MSSQEVKIFQTEDEVKAYYEADKENNQIVLFNGVVYDVKEFAPDHPGGSDYVTDNFGTDIDEKFEEAEHTKFARNMFKDFKIVGKMASKVASEPKDTSGMPLVTITGISGYIGAQVCLYFLKDGNFRVRGTVRSTKNAAKIDPLKKAFKEYFKQLELVEADLLDEASIIKAIKGSTYVVHTASPFTIDVPKDENVLIKPAVNGTLAVMKGCQAAKVKRCVVTSSIAAIDSPKKDYFTSEDWSNYQTDPPYPKSKALAEKAAWDFVKKLPKEEQFELVVINPGFVIGPNLNSAYFSSGEIFKKMMLGEFQGTPKMSMPIVDVRDVAQAHLQALKVPEAAGQRFILSEATYPMADLAGVLYKDYAHLGYQIPNSDMPYWMIALASLFDSQAASIKKYWGRTATFENGPTKKVLGINFIPMKKSAPDMVKTLIDTGYIPNYAKDGKPASNTLMKLILFIVTMAVVFYALNLQFKWISI